MQYCTVGVESLKQHLPFVIMTNRWQACSTFGRKRPGMLSIFIIMTNRRQIYHYDKFESYGTEIYVIFVIMINLATICHNDKSGGDFSFISLSPVY